MVGCYHNRLKICWSGGGTPKKRAMIIKRERQLLKIKLLVSYSTCYCLVLTSLLKLLRKKVMETKREVEDALRPGVNQKNGNDNTMEVRRRERNVLYSSIASFTKVPSLMSKREPEWRKRRRKQKITQPQSYFLVPQRKRIRMTEKHGFGNQGEASIFAPVVLVYTWTETDPLCFRPVWTRCC